MDENQFALESFKNIQELIKFSDQKAGGVLVVFGFELTIFFDSIKTLDFHNVYSNAIAILVIIFVILTAILMLVSLIISIFYILKPRLAVHYSGRDISLLYFNHLASITDKTEMFDNFKQLNDEKILRQLTDQIFEISKILDKKIKYLNYSMIFLFSSTSCLIIFISLSKFL